MALSVTTIETAIAAIESGNQSATVDGMSFSRANLATLYTMLKDERNRALRTAGTRPLFRAFGFNSMGYGSTGTGDADIVKTVTP